MATNYERWVDVDADAGGTGASNALTGAACAFKSLSLAEAAGGGASQPPLNLTTNGDTYTIWCQSTHANHTADTTVVVVGGYTTSATNNIRIKGVTGVGNWSDTKYRLYITGSVTGVSSGQQYTYWSDLQFKGGSGAYNMFGTTASDQTIERCLISGNALSRTIIICSANNTNFNNCVIFDGVRGVGNIAYTGSFTNCTFANTATSSYYIVYANKMNYVNCIFADASCYGDVSYVSTATTTYCASTGTGCTGTGCITSINTANTFVNFGTDFHLVSGASCRGAGTATGAPSVDYEGEARSGSIDIGADQYVAAASGPTNLSTFAGLAKASVSNIDGLALASVASVNGLT